MKERSSALRNFLALILITFATSNAFGQSAKSVNTAAFLYGKAGLAPVEPALLRCGGPCTSKPCALRPKCKWQNSLKNIKVIDFIDGKFSDVDDGDILQRRGAEQNVFRYNCDSENPKAPVTFQRDAVTTHTVELEHNTRLTRTTSKKIAVDIGAKLGLVDVKVGGEIQNTSEFEVGTRSSETKSHEFSETINYIWEEIPPLRKHWIQKYKIFRTVLIPYSGSVILDAEWIRTERIVNPNGSLGKPWSAPKSQGLLSNTRLVNPNSRKLKLDMTLIPTGSSEDYFEKYHAAETTDEDCPLGGDWPTQISSLDYTVDEDEDKWELIRTNDPYAPDLLPVSVKGKGEKEPEVCSAEEDTAEQTGDSLSVLFDVEVKGCLSDSHGSITFDSVARDANDGELVIRENYRSWNYEDEDDFQVDYFDSSHFGDDEEFLKISDIDVECNCF